MKNYKTSQIAEKCGVHPNTVRLYEELGFIPPVPRANNGYRLYSKLHLEHVRLVRAALKSTWLGGVIRQKALLVLHLSAAGSHEEAMQLARDHLVLVRKERKKAETASKYLEVWAAINDYRVGSSVKYWKTKETADRLDISQDMLRSWERNGLITVPRNMDNGYRIYGDDEIQRLYVIRALRKARFSLMSIHRMFQQYDNGVREGLIGILNEPPPEEEDICYHTDQWLIKIRNIEESAHEMINRLYMIKNLLEQ